MIIRWTRDSVEKFPVVADNGVHMRDITLLPGLNEVSAVDWGAVRTGLRDLVRRGVIVVEREHGEELGSRPGASGSVSTSQKKGRKRTVSRRTS